MRRYYQILGVSPRATQQEIKEAWLFSLKAFHPDKFSNSSAEQQRIAHERTKAINEAYALLSDPVKRANYDREYSRESGPPPPPRSPPPPPPPPRPQSQNTGQRPVHDPPRHAKRSWFWGPAGPPKYRWLIYIAVVAIGGIYLLAIVDQSNRPTTRPPQIHSPTTLSLEDLGKKPDLDRVGKPSMPKATPVGSASVAAPAIGEDRALNLPALAHKARSAVVLIVGYDMSGKPIKTGSGFFVSEDGRLVTNDHVVQGISNAQARLENGAIYNIRGVLASSAVLDLAVLKAEARSVEFLKVDDAPPPEPGTRVAVIGSPLALENTLSEGIVSANRITEQGSWLQISAPISPGSSGSPVIDRHGKVIGVATLVLTEGQNLNFARSSRDLAKFLENIQPDAKPIALASVKAPSLFDEPDFKAAVEANNRKDGAKALESLNRLPKQLAENESILFQRGLALAYVGLYEESFFVFRKYVELRPTDDVGWSNMAVSAFNCGRQSEATNAAKQAIKLNSNNALAWWTLTSVYGLTNQLELAADAKRRAEALDAKRKRAEELEKRRRMAIEAAQMETKRDPNNSHGWWTLAEAYTETGQSELAREARQQAEALDSKQKEEQQKLAAEGQAEMSAAQEKTKQNAEDQSASPASASSPSRPVYVVIGHESKGLNLRLDHRANSTVIKTLRPGERVFLEPYRVENNDPPYTTTWQEVTTMNGDTGWIAFDYLAPFSSPNQQAAPAASGSPAPAVTPMPADAEVRQLFEQWFRASNDGNAEQEASLYSESTDYLDFGTLTHQQLLQELQKDRQRWQQQQYSTYGKAPFIEKVSDSEWHVNFEVNFDVRNPSQLKRVTGTAKLNWIVKKRPGGGVEITSSKEEVINRTYHDAKRKR